MLDVLVVALDERQNAVIGGVGGALETLDIAIGDVVASHGEGALGHNLILDHVLDFFYGDGVAADLALSLHRGGCVIDLRGGQTKILRHGDVGFGYSIDDLGNIKGDL